MRPPFKCYITNEGQPFILDDKDYVIKEEGHELYKIKFNLTINEMKHILLGSSYKTKSITNRIYYNLCDYFDTYKENPLGSQHKGIQNVHYLADKMIYCIQNIYNCSVDDIDKQKLIEDLSPDGCFFKYIFSRSKTCKEIANTVCIHFSECIEEDPIITAEDSIIIRVSIKDQLNSFVFDIEFNCNQ